MQKTVKKTNRYANIYKRSSGKYRARKFVNGKRLSKDFTLLREAKAWLNSL